MPAKRLSMRKIKEVLRPKWERRLSDRRHQPSHGERVSSAFGRSRSELAIAGGSE